MINKLYFLLYKKDKEIHYKYRNEYLENYFNISPNKKLDSNIFGSYGQDMYELKKNNYLESYQEKFKQHYNNFKPVLDDIKKFDKSNLNDHKNQSIYDRLEIYKHKYEVSKELKKKYIKSDNVEPYFPDIPKIEEYNSMLGKIQENIPKDNLNHFCDYLNNNPSEVEDHLLRSKPFHSMVSDYSKVPSEIVDDKLHCCIKHIRESKDLIEHLFVNLDMKDLELLDHYVKHHKSLTLLTLEPYMLAILGNVMFLDILMPLHYSNSFDILMNDIISRKKLALNPLDVGLYKYNTYLTKSYNFYNDYNKYSSICLGTMSFITLIKPYVINLLNSNSTKQVTTATDLAKNLLSGEGYSDNNIINLGISHANKLSFTVGKALGSIGKSFIQGIASNHESTILSGSKSIDEQLTKKVNK